MNSTLQLATSNAAHQHVRKCQFFVYISISCKRSHEMYILIFFSNTYVTFMPCMYYTVPPAVYTHFFRRHAMEIVYFVNLASIFVVNILFFFSGICLNSLVIVSFWRSVQLRKKLCYFTIIILSCCDLLVVLTTQPVTALVTMFWLTENMNVHPGWLVVSHGFSLFFIALSVVALFVMSVDRYLATHCPLFHRTSVTKRKLLTLFTFLVIILIIVAAICINNLVIPQEVGMLVFGTIFIPPMLLINYKLFTVARKSRRNNEILPETKKSFSLKNVSSCLLAVACLILLSTPCLVYIGLIQISKEKGLGLDNAYLAGLWARTAGSINSTLNCLIFYWKNKILRAEGIKVIKSIKISRKGQSSS